MTPAPESCPVRRERFARIKRVKQLLRYLPRRANLHHYPLVGRFADAARRRAYLWSFKPAAMRPAFYAGSILSLLPLLGVQLPLAFALALLLRANFMVLGGLQFITTPFTAPPIYYATHQLGRTVITAVGYGESLPVADPSQADLFLGDKDEPLPPPPPRAEDAANTHWTHRFGTAVNALIIGGVLSGAALGLLLDILNRNYWQNYTLTHPPRPPAPGRANGPPEKPPEIPSPS